LVALCIYIKVSVSSIPKNKLFKYKELLEELLNLGKFPELISIFEKNLSKLYKIYRSDFMICKIRSLLKRRIEPTLEDRLSKIDLEKMQSAMRNIVDNTSNNNDYFEPIFGQPNLSTSKIKSIINKIQSNSIKLTLRLLPSNDKSSEIANEIFHTLLVSNNFTQNLIKIRPYFGIKLIELELFEKHDFFYSYLKTMLSNTDSILYYELTNSCNVDTQLNYYIPASNKFLSYILNDAKNAETLYAWKPVGDGIISILDDLYKSKGSDPYNMPLDDFSDEGKWKSPIFAGIRFFDIMVAKAIHQNIEWHMWLYYFDHWTDRICRNYDPQRKYVDLSEQFPTKYSYLLYEIISVIINWIKLVKILPKEKPNFIIQKNNLETENNSIIKCSMLCLGRSIGSIVNCELVSFKFKKNILMMVFNLYFDLRLIVGSEIYSLVLLNSVINQGMRFREIDSNYLGSIIHAFIENDNIPHKYEHVNEAIQELFDAYYKKFGLDNLKEHVDYTNNHGKVVISAPFGNRYSVRITPES
jgi:hypothetical protein